jgi:hypothetical protein
MSRNREIDEIDLELSRSFPHIGDVRREQEIAKNKALLATTAGNGNYYTAPEVRGRKTWKIEGHSVTLFGTKAICYFASYDYDPKTSMISRVRYVATGIGTTERTSPVQIADRTDVKLDLFSMTVDIKLTKSEEVRIAVGRDIINGTMSPLSDVATRIKIRSFWHNDCEWDDSLNAYATRSVEALENGEHPSFNLTEKLYIGWRVMLMNRTIDYYTTAKFLQMKYENSQGFDPDDPLAYDKDWLTDPFDEERSGDDFRTWAEGSFRKDTSFGEYGNTGHKEFEDYLTKHYQHFTERRILRPDGTPRFHNTPETLFPFWAKIAAKRKVNSDRDSASKRTRVRTRVIYL